MSVTGRICHTLFESVCAADLWKSLTGVFSRTGAADTREINRNVYLTVPVRTMTITNLSVRWLCGGHTNSSQRRNFEPRRGGGNRSLYSAVPDHATSANPLHVARWQFKPAQEESFHAKVRKMVTRAGYPGGQSWPGQCRRVSERSPAESAE